MCCISASLPKAWPNAKIVHLHRHPLDACFAVFKQSFFRFAYSLDDLAEYYLAYHSLSRHWRETLGSRMVELSYEGLVADPEGEMRRLLESLGLDFEEACLNFERNVAPVATASSVQVREKVHSRSVGSGRISKRNCCRYAPDLSRAALSFEEEDKMLKLIRALMMAMCAISVAFVVPALAENSDDDGILRCASLDDAQERLACYDGLTDREASTPDLDALPAAASAPPAVTTPSSAVPPDDFGSESLARKDDDEDVPVVVRVNRCTKDSFKDYLFYLEGGQVWKQVSDKKLSFPECDFNATISRDYFGFKMQIEGEKSRFRVKRVR